MANRFPWEPVGLCLSIVGRSRIVIGVRTPLKPRSVALFWCAALLLTACERQPEPPEISGLPDSVSLELYRSVRDELGASQKQPPTEADIMTALAQRLTKVRTSRTGRQARPSHDGPGDPSYDAYLSTDPNADQLDAAVACWERVPSDHPQHGAEARLQQGLLLVTLRRAAEAESNLQEFIELAQAGRSLPPAQVAEALDMLRFLLGVELRFEERHGILRAIHLLGAADTNDAITYCFPSVLRWNGEQAVQWLEEFWEQTPDDFVLRVALGRYRTGQGQLDQAEQILRQCCDERPSDLSAQAALLACLYERADWEQMNAKLEELPPASKNDPWLLLRLRGHVHNHFGRFQQAFDAFTMAIDADPANGESYLGLGKALAGLQRPEESEIALQKTSVIARIQNRLGWIQVRQTDISALWGVTELCEQANLNSRASVMARHLLKLDPAHRGARELLERLATQPKE
jgi:tetratricopeptide (TPR) repeat protein